MSREAYAQWLEEIQKASRTEFLTAPEILISGEQAGSFYIYNIYHSKTFLTIATLHFQWKNN